MQTCPSALAKVFAVLFVIKSSVQCVFLNLTKHTPDSKFIEPSKPLNPLFIYPRKHI